VNFISRFLDWNKFAESPESYFRWAAISALGATMRDNVYHESGVNSKLFPNLFILNIGPPGIGKQLPMRQASQLIASVGNTRIIAGSASMQAVIKALGTYEQGGVKGASCILYSEELSSFYVKDQGTNELLTDLSDYHETWERNLISWNAKLTKVCISLFAASNETLLRKVLDSSAIYGGLLSRTLVNIEKRKRKKDLMIKKVQTDSQHEAILKNHLKCVSKLRGGILFDPAAEIEFENWYGSWDEEGDKTGLKMRMKTHIKKVAMCLAMAEECLDLIIRRPHVEEAILLCLGLQKNYQILTMEAGNSPNAHPAALIMRALVEAKDYRLSKTVILRRFVGELTVEILDSVILQMTGAELITEHIADNRSIYVLTPQALEIYRNL
jgi:hypothetical protein